MSYRNPIIHPEFNVLIILFSRITQTIGSIYILQLFHNSIHGRTELVTVDFRIGSDVFCASELFWKKLYFKIHHYLHIIVLIIGHEHVHVRSNWSFSWKWIYAPSISILKLKFYNIEYRSLWYCIVYTKQIKPQHGHRGLYYLFTITPTHYQLRFIKEREKI